MPLCLLCCCCCCCFPFIPSIIQLNTPTRPVIHLHRPVFLSLVCVCILAYNLPDAWWRRFSSIFKFVRDVTVGPTFFFFLFLYPFSLIYNFLFFSSRVEVRIYILIGLCCRAFDFFLFLFIRLLFKITCIYNPSTFRVGVIFVISSTC